MVRPFLVLLGLALGLPGPAQIPAPAPAPTRDVIAMKGSDSMDPLIRLWISEFNKRRSGTEFNVTSHGSGTAPPALAAGEVALGHMSREMTPAELAAFQSKRGFPVTRLVVAHDALAIYVNRANPLKRIALGQLDALYSQERLSGWDKPIRTWGDLGLTGRWRRKGIRFLGRDEKSGTRTFFDERILQKGGKLRAGYEVHDQWGVLEGIASDPLAIGYGPATYANPEVRTLPVLAWSGMYYLPTPANVLAGRYPLTRNLFVYVAKEPGKPLPPATRAFLAFILGPGGQKLVQEWGSVAIPEKVAEAQLAALES